MYHVPLQVKVWGPMACFTRPEQKVERVTYEVMTPSAARGVLEAIFWKPEFTWQVRQIAVLQPIRHISLLRNEVKSRIPVRTVQNWASDEGRGQFVIEDDRTQRHTLALRDVSYLISADIRLAAGVQQDAAKYRDQFRRRVERGQCYSMPYLGCREFSAFFGPPDGSEQPLDINADLGLMLYDLAYQQDRSGRGTPRFFSAILEHGLLSVPANAPLAEGPTTKDLV